MAATMTTMPHHLVQEAGHSRSGNHCGSLLFDLEAEEQQRTLDYTAASSRIAGLRERLEFLQDSGAGPFGLRLQRDVKRLIRLLQKDDIVDVIVLASRLALVGYSVSFRTAIGGGPSCFRNLRHEFLSITGEDEYKETQLIVDPYFKEQFEIPQPTAMYRAVLDLLPYEFVGTASRLVPLVQCLCAEMAASFEAMGLTLPPWRRAQSMLSKWLPSRSRDIPFSSNGSGSNNSASNANSCCSDNEGCSPTGCSADSSMSPFSRISDLQIADRVTRQNSSKSLLSGKLGSLSGSSINNCSSRGLSYRSIAGDNLQQQLAVGTVSKQPPVFKGQPPTYKVKIGARAC